MNGSTLVTEYSKDGGDFTSTTAVKGFKDENGDKTEGSWGYDKNTGYGPFGSFYAAFDPAQNNAMIYHLNPYDLTESVDGTDISGKGYNIMWCLPKIYLSVTQGEKGVGTMIMASDASYGGKLAPAFTLIDDDGRSVEYNYIALGVYEATCIDGRLGSVSGEYPQCDTPLETFRSEAKANGVTDGLLIKLWNFHQWQLYRYCSLAVMDNFDSQGQVGYGNCDNHVSDSPLSQGGALNGEGPYYGTSGQNDDGVKLFIENVWGSLSEYVDDTWVSGGVWAGQNVNPVNGSQGKTQTEIGNLAGNAQPPYFTDATLWGLPITVEFDAPGDYFFTDSQYYSDNTFNAGGASHYGEVAGLNFLNPGLFEGSGTTGARLAMYFKEDNPIGISTVKYDHSQLISLLKEFGYSEELASGLPEKATGAGRYDQLEDVAEFRHVGWMVYGKQYAATSEFVDKASHTAVSVWVGLPAVTYDHSQLIELSGDRYSEAGLNNGLEIRGHDRYEQLPDRAGYTHIGWDVNGKTVDPTATFVTRQSHTAKSLWAPIPTVIFDHTNLTDIVGLGAKGVSDLAMSMPIKGNSNYPELPFTAGYRHIGWEVDGKTLEATAKLESQTTHTAKSLWVEIPTVVFDHSYLTDIVGKDAKGISDLETSMTIEGNSNYPQLPNTAGYRHVGWEVNGKTVGPTAVLDSEITHEAKSLWEKIPQIIPIIPGGTESEEQGAVVPIVVEEEHGFWSQNNGKSLLIIAIIAAIIAELAVLSISRRK